MNRHYFENRTPSLVLVLFAFLSLNALAMQVIEGEDDYMIDRWDVEDGLPGAQVLSLAQSTDGYIWAGTLYGLARFDGNRFVVFDAETPGFPHRSINNIHPDPQGGLLLIAGQSDFVRYNNGRFTSLNQAFAQWGAGGSKIIHMRPNGEFLVRKFSEDFGKAHLLEYDNGIVRHLATVDNPSHDNRTWVSAAVDNKQQLWIGVGNLLGRVTGDGWRQEFKLKEDEKGLVGPYSCEVGGLWFIDAGQVRRWEGGHWFDGEIQLNDPSARVIHVFQGDFGGDLWVVDDKYRFSRYSKESKGGYRLVQQIGGIAIGSLRSVVFGGDGGIWIPSGRRIGGLRRYRPRIFRRHGFMAEWDGPICSIGQKSNGGLVFAGDSGLYQFSKSGETGSSPLESSLERIGSGHYRSLYVDPDDGVWGGIYARINEKARRSDPKGPLFHVKNGEVSNLDPFGVGLSRRITALCRDLDGRLWIASRDDGLAAWDGTQTIRFSVADGLPTNLINALACDSKGRIWIGTVDAGLVLYSGGAFKHFSPEDGFSANQVRSILVDKEDTLWIGTGGRGIFRLREGVFTQFSTRDGLPVNEVNTIVDDELGYLWFGSYRGIHRVARRNLEAVADGKSPHLYVNSFTLADGLSSMQCSLGHPASLRTTDGRLWFGTTKGVNVVDPKDLQFNPNPPRVFIESVRINGRPMTGFSENDPNIVLSAGSNRIDIDYTALSFAAPREIQFRHRLKGSDTSWTEAGRQRSATFSALRPGRYRFQVLAANNHGVWNEEGASVNILVKAQFWQTGWFRAVASLSFVGLGIGFYRIRILQEKSRRTAKEQFARDVIEHQEGDRRRVARELHDSLEQNLLVMKNRAMMTLLSSESPNSATEALREISEISSASISEVRAIAHNLRPYQIDRLGLTKAIESMFRQLSEASGLEIQHQVDPLDDRLDPELQINLYRMIQEGMNNILKHAGANRATVIVLLSERELKVRIEDNGKGFDSSQLQRSRAQRTFGLNGIHERVELFRGECTVSSRPGQGCKWWIRIPIASA